MGIAVSSKRPKEAKVRDDDNRLWWTAPKQKTPGPSEVARRLQSWMNQLEQQTWTTRYANLTWYRLMTGRAAGPTTFNFSSTSRPSSLTALWRRSTFSAPRDGILPQCSDALHARVYSQRPFLFVTPIDGDFKARVKSKKLTHFLDASFYDLKLWPMIEQAGYDCRTWGTAFIKIDVSRDGKRIEATRVLPDETVCDENELNAGSEPLHLGVRVFANRAVMLAEYGDNEAARQAIMDAPRSSNGVVMGADYDTTDVIVLRESWALPVGNQPGRHVLSVGGYAFVDEEYTRDHYPLAKLIFHPLPTGYYGMGMPEMVAGLVKSLEFQLAAIDENHRRASWPRILIAKGSNVNPSSLGDTSNGISHYSGVEPKFVFPEAMSPGQYQYVQYLRNLVKERFRLNDQVSSGQKPKFTSGEAIVQEDRVNDEAHVDLFQHLESFIEQIGVLIIEAAEICKPTVRLPGRKLQEIKWSDVQIAKSSYSLRVFKVSQLSQTPAARQEKIDKWFAEGVITKAIKMRLEQVPDTDGYANLANSSLDYVEFVLDSIIEDGNYEPPEPWLDLPAALQTAQSRYLTEKRQKTPQDRLDMLLQWIFQVQELIGDATGPANDNAPAGPQSFGIQPPAAPPPGAPQAPFPIAPAMSAPAAA